MRCTTWSGVVVAARPMRRQAARIRSMAVPVSRSSYGTDETSGGLSMTMTWASSWTMSASRIGSRGLGAARRTSTASPPRMRASIATTGAPPTSTLPVAIHFFTTDHGSPLASLTTAAKVAPAASAATVQGAGTGIARMYYSAGDRVATDPRHRCVGPRRTQPARHPHGDPRTYGWHHGCTRARSS